MFDFNNEEPLTEDKAHMNFECHHSCALTIKV